MITTIILIFLLLWVLTLEMRVRGPKLREIFDQLQRDAMRAVSAAKAELGEIENDARDRIDQIRKRL